jgi:hypothetical protein
VWSWKNLFRFVLISFGLLATFLGVAALSDQNRRVCGPPTYACSRTDVEITQPDAPPMIDFGGLRGANSVFHDSVYNNIEIVRCTDAFTNPVNPNASYMVGVGGSGEKNSWNVDDSLVAIGDSGVGHILRFDPASKSCRPVCRDESTDLHCAGSALLNVWNGVFSKVNPQVYYAYPQSSALVRAITIGPGAPSAAVTVVDFSPALYKGHNPEWVAKTPITLGTVIQPTRNNPTHSLFQAVAPGKTGSKQPIWDGAKSPYRSSNHTPLPLPDWSAGRVGLNFKINPMRNNADGYIFKATVAGQTAATAPAWCQTSGCTVTDGSVIWTNGGHSATISDGTVTWVKIGPTRDETWTTVGGVENHDRNLAFGVSYTGYQDTGLWIVMYDTQLNKFFQLNTYSKIETDFACVGGSGHDCRGGRWEAKVIGKIDSQDAVTVHDVILALNGHDVVFVCGAYGGPCNSINKIWHTGTATWDEVLTSWDGHSFVGYHHFVNQGGFDHLSGHYWAYRKLNNAAENDWAWTANPCTDLLAGPPYPTPPCAPSFDIHPSWIYNKGNDEEPAIGAHYTQGKYPSYSPWQNEIVGVSMCGLKDEPECPPGYPSDRAWRFGRTFNFGTNRANFNSYASIGVLSQTGKYYALTSSGHGTLGSTSGEARCRAGYSWSKSHQYSHGRTITPYWTANARGYTFQANCSGSCTSGATEPFWPQDEGTVVIDNEVRWKAVGITNCRSDVLIYKLQ